MPVNAKHISEISIENFRGFQKLELKGLQAVNLIVGQNNAGKTSLLEALALGANPSIIGQLPGLLRANAGNVDQRFFRWLIQDGKDAQFAILNVAGEEVNNKVRLDKDPRTFGGRSEVFYHSPQLVVLCKEPPKKLRVRLVSVQHIAPEALVKSVGNALRKREGEEIIHAVLRKIDSRILRLRVDPVEEGNIVAVDIGLSEMIPLPQVGQGVYRLVSMLSELIGENAQVCIIDEIENGIHHTVMKEVWKGIAEISSMLGVQVFATTHSKECLEAAQEVFCTEDSANERDFAVIQLMRVNDQVVGKVLSESRVEAALENHIELR